MEKLIIEYYQNYDTEEEKEALSQRTLSICKNPEKGFQAMVNYMEKYCDDNYVRIVREYPEKIFKNMKTIEEVYEFLLKEQDCIGKAINVPNSFEKLEPWLPSYLKEDEKWLAEAKKDKFCFANDWKNEKKIVK